MIEFDFAIMIPIVAILASAWIGVTWMRTRATGTDATVAADNRRLTAENSDLKRLVGRMEERLAVLERIATDPAERTAREIEQLR